MASISPPERSPDRQGSTTSSNAPCILSLSAQLWIMSTEQFLRVRLLPLRVSQASLLPSSLPPPACRRVLVSVWSSFTCAGFSGISRWALLLRFSLAASPPFRPFGSSPLPSMDFTFFLTESGLKACRVLLLRMTDSQKPLLLCGTPAFCRSARSSHSSFTCSGCHPRRLEDGSTLEAGPAMLLPSAVRSSEATVLSRSDILLAFILSDSLEKPFNVLLAFRRDIQNPRSWTTELPCLCLRLYNSSFSSCICSGVQRLRPEGPSSGCSWRLDATPIRRGVSVMASPHSDPPRRSRRAFMRSASLLKPCRVRLLPAKSFQKVLREVWEPPEGVHRCESSARTISSFSSITLSAVHSSLFPELSGVLASAGISASGSTLPEPAWPPKHCPEFLATLSLMPRRVVETHAWSSSVERLCFLLRACS
mmetsp:Transcript_7145/g.20180  ORF Transcript_7145/g.20180 Transcript_7145/m.20180 type:complete len:422 (-) Transcript_7145:1398-2663(-)